MPPFELIWQLSPSENTKSDRRMLLKPLPSPRGGEKLPFLKVEEQIRGQNEPGKTAEMGRLGFSVNAAE